MCGNPNLYPSSSPLNFSAPKSGQLTLTFELNRNQIDCTKKNLNLKIRITKSVFVLYSLACTTDGSAEGYGHFAEYIYNALSI